MKKENKIQRQEPTPIGYSCICTYSLTSKDYTEVNREFNLSAKTYSGLVAKIMKVYSTYAEDTKSYTLYSPWSWADNFRNEPHHGSFDAAYIFGPKVHYDIYIRKHYSESFTD